MASSSHQKPGDPSYKVSKDRPCRGNPDPLPVPGNRATGPRHKIAAAHRLRHTTTIAAVGHRPPEWNIHRDNYVKTCVLHALLWLGGNRVYVLRCDERLVGPATSRPKPGWLASLVGRSVLSITLRISLLYTPLIMDQSAYLFCSCAALTLTPIIWRCTCKLAIGWGGLTCGE